MSALIYRNNFTRAVAVLVPAAISAAFFYILPFIDWIQSFGIFAIFIIGVLIPRSPPGRSIRTWPPLRTFQWAGTLAERSFEGRKHAGLLNMLVADALNIGAHGFVISGLIRPCPLTSEFSRPALAIGGMIFWVLVYYLGKAGERREKGKRINESTSPMM
ncbi:hypothetical protein [Delftia sp. JD2]|uniref:hypothetical protein n=1 Tax=Delftia sp. JD2 TaxID=469553 RepID=UPI001111DD73|nr:hypothetical protein [Delftia sp. JD2]